MRRIVFVLTVALIISTGAWIQYDRVVALVNDTPIVESEVERKLDQLVRLGKMRGRSSYYKSRVLDMFIERALVQQTAEDESIIVSDEKVVNQMRQAIEEYVKTVLGKKEDAGSAIEQISAQLVSRYKNELIEKKNPEAKKLTEGFISYIERKQRMPFEDFFHEIRNQIMREQVMSISIGVSPPSEEEAKKWYRAHRYKLGYEVKLQHIMIRPRGNSFSAQREISKKMQYIRDRIARGASFSNMARKHSEDVSSAANGGNMGWVAIHELDPIFAQHVHNMKGSGLSQVFKTKTGYHIVRIQGQRSVTYERVKQLIMNKLYYEKMNDQFDKWVEARKERSEIRIYMDNYVKG